MIDRLMKPRNLDGLRYAFYDLDFFWRRRSESRVTFARCRVSGERGAKKDHKTYD